MDKNTLLKIIKYNYINQFKSLNYNLKNSYPVTWNKDLFTESIKDINFKNIELIKDQYINAITSSLNLDDINNTTYDDAINNLLRSTNININELEYILKEYIDENKDNLDNLQPVNALNNTNLMSKLDMLHNGYYILNGSNNSNQSLLLKRAAYIVAYARGDIDREAADARAAALRAQVEREAAATAAERAQVEREAAAERARVEREAADKRRIAEAAAKATAFHEQMRDASVRLNNMPEICNKQYQSNLANIKSLQPSYLKLIENVKLSITQKVDVNSEYVKINSIEISPINIEGTLKDILRVLIQDPSDDLIDNIYIDITDNTKPKIGKYKITPNSFIKQDEFQTLLEEIKEIYIKNTNLLNEFEKFKGIILSLVDILSDLSNLKQDIVALNKQIDDEAKIKEEYELYLEDIKSTYDELKRYLIKNKLYLNADLKEILPSLNKAMSEEQEKNDMGLDGYLSPAFSTYSKILELIAQFKVVPSAMGLKPIYKEVNKILIHMESIYKKKYENIKDDLIVFPHNLDELKQSKLDMIEQISNTIDSHNAECDKIFNKFLVMTGGNSANKELLYNAVAAFLIQNSNQKNFKSLLISLISNNIKIKNNKINIVLPKMNEILKIISLPLYCTDKGINVKYSTMQKCVKNNIHKYVDNDNTNKYLKELNLNSNDKLLAKEFDYRISNIQKIINKK